MKRPKPHKGDSMKKYIVLALLVAGGLQAAQFELSKFVHEDEGTEFGEHGGARRTARRTVRRVGRRN